MPKFYLSPGGDVVFSVSAFDKRGWSLSVVSVTGASYTTTQFDRHDGWRELRFDFSIPEASLPTSISIEVTNGVNSQSVSFDVTKTTAMFSAADVPDPVYWGVAEGVMGVKGDGPVKTLPSAHLGTFLQEATFSHQDPETIDNKAGLRRNAINGHPSLVLDRANEYLFLDYWPNPQKSVFMVARIIGTSSSARALISSVNTVGWPSGSGRVTMAVASGSERPYLEIRNNVTGSYDKVMCDIVYDAFHIIQANFGQESADVPTELFINGSLMSSGTIGQRGNLTTGGLYIASGAGIELAEVIVYNTIVSEGDRMDITGYLQSKYGL